MNNNELRNKALETIAFYTDLGNEIFKTNMKTPLLDCSLKGQVGGKYHTREHKVKVNMVLFAENYDDYIENTIPHEVAHAFQRHLFEHYDDFGSRVMPHGKEWKRIMLAFGKNPKVTHSYDVSNSTQRTVAREFVYRCGCKEHKLTIIKHRRMQKAMYRGGAYVCKRCKGKLEYAGRESLAA